MFLRYCRRVQYVRVPCTFFHNARVVAYTLPAQKGIVSLTGKSRYQQLTNSYPKVTDPKMTTAQILLVVLGHEVDIDPFLKTLLCVGSLNRQAQSYLRSRMTF